MTQLPKKMNTNRDLFFLEGRTKPQFYLSTIIEGKNKGKDQLSDYQDISTNLLGQDNSTKDYTENKEDKVPLKRTFHLSSGVRQPSRANCRVKRAAPALNTLIAYLQPVKPPILGNTA